MLDPRDRRRPPPALALAEARRGGRRAGAARRRRRVRPLDPRPEALRGGVPDERRRRGDASPRRTTSRAREDAVEPSADAAEAVAEPRGGDRARDGRGRGERRGGVAEPRRSRATRPSGDRRRSSRRPSRATRPRRRRTPSRPRRSRSTRQPRRSNIEASAERRRARARVRQELVAGSPRPIAVAITGGIGAGKSTALDAFRAHGAAVVSSDEIVHHLLATDDGVRDALVAKLGAERSSARTADPTARGSRARCSRDRERLAWLEAAPPPARLARVPRVARAARRARRAAARVRHRGAAALRGRRRGALRPRRRDHGARGASRAAAPRRRATTATPGCCRTGEGAPGRLPLRQHRDVRGARTRGSAASCASSRRRRAPRREAPRAWSRCSRSCVGRRRGWRGS